MSEPAFIESNWKEQLKYPDWYIRLATELGQIVFHPTKPDKTRDQRHKIYGLVEKMLNNGEIPLAKTGPSFDKERKPIDTIVIHHTSEEKDITMQKLSAIGLVRQYALNYLEDDEIRGNKVKGSPIWSNHFRNDKMVFYAYHWLIREDGTTDRLLDDFQIGWQAGNWDINTRSVAIAFSGDYTNSPPSVKAVESAKRLIADKYGKVINRRIFNHREVNKATDCPGKVTLV